MLRRPDQARIPVMTAAVVVARQDIPAGQEVRWDYDHCASRPFRAAMIARGVAARDLDSADYLHRRWLVTAPLVNRVSQRACRAGCGECRISLNLRFGV